MSHRLTVSCSVLLAIGLFAGVTAVGRNGTTEGLPQTDPADTAATQIVVWNGTDNRQPRQVVDWVVGRFHLAGLQAPEAEIRFHPFNPAFEECAGFPGFYTFDDPGHRIDICAVGERSRRRTLLHELAHAWTYEHLDETERNAFLADQGLEVWNDADVPWEERGAEHAATLIAVGLDLHCDPRDMIDEDDLGSLAAAFEDLTGARPICR
jgi:hypothetical protein